MIIMILLKFMHDNEVVILDEKSDSIYGDDDDVFVGDAAGVCGERVCV